MNNANTQRIALILWILLVAFILRVIGQLMVVLNLGGWLPPIEEWQSGLLPYPYLFVSQIAIIIYFPVFKSRISILQAQIGKIFSNHRAIDFP